MILSRVSSSSLLSKLDRSSDDESYSTTTDSAASFIRISGAPSRSDSQCSCLSCSVPGEIKRRESRLNPGVRANDYYRFDEILGEGTYSVVYLAESRSEKEHWVAIKVIEKTSLSGKEDMTWLIEREIRIMTILDHPHIIHLNEVFEETDSICLVMELAKGGEIFDRLIELGSFSERETAALIVQLLCALNYLHELGIVHRDLKLENLLYYDDTEDSKIMMADFGLSEWVWEINENSPLCGTPGYMAPEVIDKNIVTPAADIWSVGVITYVLLAGYPPFCPQNGHDSGISEAEEETALLDAIVKGKFDFHSHTWENISDEAKDFIRRLMSLKHNDRPSCLEALDHPWLQNAQVRHKNPPHYKKWSPRKVVGFSFSVVVISMSYVALISYFFQLTIY